MANIKNGKWLTIVLAVCLLAWQPACRRQPEPPPERAPIVFRASATEIGGAAESDRAGSGDAVEVTLEGTVHDPPIARGTVDRDAASWETPTDALVSEFSALKADDIQWILANAVFEDREEIGTHLLDDAVRAASLDFFSRLEEVRIWAEAYYRKDFGDDIHDDFAFVVFSYDGSPERNVDTYKHTREGWKTTGELDEDPTAEIVRAAAASGSFRKM